MCLWVHQQICFDKISSIAVKSYSGNRVSTSYQQLPLLPPKIEFHSFKFHFTATQYKRKKRPLFPENFKKLVNRTRSCIHVSKQVTCIRKCPSAIHLKCNLLYFRINLSLKKKMHSILSLWHTKYSTRVEYSTGGSGKGGHSTHKTMKLLFKETTSCFKL